MLARCPDLPTHIPRWLKMKWWDRVSVFLQYFIQDCNCLRGFDIRTAEVWILVKGKISMSESRGRFPCLNPDAAGSSPLSEHRDKRLGGEEAETLCRWFNRTLRFFFKSISHGCQEQQKKIENLCSLCPIVTSVAGGYSDYLKQLFNEVVVFAHIY